MVVLLGLWLSIAGAAPPKLSIFHFDVNTGDATLILSPGGRGVLIDAGNRGRGLNPIAEFLARAKHEGLLVSLDYTIATHYDADHIGGMSELLAGPWYPAEKVYDRGNRFMPPFDRTYVTKTCRRIDASAAEALVTWNTAPPESCPRTRRVSCELLEYFIAAESGGRRAEIRPGDRIVLDHDVEIQAIVVNAMDADGNSVDVHFAGRRDDCASNDLSVGLLVSYGDFRYLIAGDLTGVRSEKVADVESLIAKKAADIDVYHVNHHGSATSSSARFMRAIRPTVTIVSNGRAFNHPLHSVIADRFLTLSKPPANYLTNRNNSEKAWQAPEEFIADLDFKGYDGMVELAIWKRSYRVYRWRDGGRLNAGDQYFIKRR